MNESFLCHKRQPAGWLSGLLELKIEVFWSTGVVEWWNMRKNKNRGYQKLRVWNDAIDYYVQTCEVFQRFPYELKRVTSQAISSGDSVHRNISEGYCRRSMFLLK